MILDSVSTVGKKKHMNALLYLQSYILQGSYYI